MNPVRRWLDARATKRLDEGRALGKRLDALVEGLRGRTDPQVQAMIAEYAGQTEWELAIDTVRAESERGAVVLTDAERRELDDLATHPGVDKRMLSYLGENRLRARDISQR
jgi:hypothetical protein